MRWPVADPVNTSIFERELEFSANGIDYRVERSRGIKPGKRAAGLHVYVRRGGAYVHDRIVSAERFTPGAVLQAMHEQDCDGCADCDY